MRSFFDKLQKSGGEGGGLRKGDEEGLGRREAAAEEEAWEHGERGAGAWTRLALAGEPGVAQTSRPGLHDTEAGHFREGRRWRGHQRTAGLGRLGALGLSV